jgi:hypothetical protein
MRSLFRRYPAAFSRFFDPSQSRAATVLAPAHSDDRVPRDPDPLLSREKGRLGREPEAAATFPKRRDRAGELVHTLFLVPDPGKEGEQQGALTT